MYANNYYKVFMTNYLNIYFNDKMNFLNEKTEEMNESNIFKDIINEDIKLFTRESLKKHANIQNGLYLSILGLVFDVTNGSKHYGPGETYHIFTGSIMTLFTKIHLTQ